MSNRRVVVTGMGIVCPVGNTVKDAWNNIKAGHSGIGLVEGFDTTAFASKIAGQVKNFDAAAYGLSPKDNKKMDLFIQYAVAAGIQAIDDCGIEINDDNRARIGLSIGSGIGGLGYIEMNHTKLMEKGPRHISPFFVPSTIINMAAGQLSIMKGIRGPSIAVTTACSTGTHSIGLSARLIQYGDADVMVCGGSEKASTPMGLGGFSALKALSTRNDEPEKASRPWDKERDGFVLGDGAGIVVLEELEHAKKRGAKIYAEFAGFGMSSDAHHMTAPCPDGSGAALAMKNAIADAGVTPDMVDYVNAHGTSTPQGDIGEIRGMRSVFGEGIRNVRISSTKSMTGHLLGAAGAIESIFSILATVDNVAPPTINLDNPDDECADLNLVANTAQEAEINYALSNSFGFGGTNSSIMFKKFKD